MEYIQRYKNDRQTKGYVLDDYKRIAVDLIVKGAVFIGAGLAVLIAVELLS